MLLPHASQRDRPSAFGYDLDLFFWFMVQADDELVDRIGDKVSVAKPEGIGRDEDFFQIRIASPGCALAKNPGMADIDDRASHLTITYLASKLAARI